MTEKALDAQPPARPALRFALPARVGLWALVVFVAVMVPWAIGSIILELLLPQQLTTYFLTEEPPPLPENGVKRGDVSYLNIAVVGLDEAKGLATLRVAGNRACTRSCAPLTLTLFSLEGALSSRVGLPPSATIAIPAEAQQITTTVELPITGQPSHYPFDTYELVLGGVMEETQPDGTQRIVHAGDRALQTYVSLQSQLQRLRARPPQEIDPGTVRAATDPYAFSYVRVLRFARPLYLPVLAVLLVVLVTTASAYSVRLQTVNQLFLGVGSMVLGVWGVRSILVPGSTAYLTAVDLALSLSILILLVGVVTRGVRHARHGGTLAPRDAPGGDAPE